jgi:type I restriction enzyme S subunit
VADGELVVVGPAESGLAAVEPGDVLFGKLRPYLAKTWFADRPAYASTELLCLQPAQGIVPRWFAYLMASRPIVEWAIATSDGTKMPRTSWNKLGECRITVPSDSYQRDVVSFLDRVTAQIDALTAAKRRMVSLLEERWQIVMRDGVGGAMTSSGPTKPSFLPWLQEIPMGWRQVKLNLVAKLGSGHTPSRQHQEWWETPTIPWITTGEVAQLRNDRVEYLTATRELISEIGISNSSATLHPAGTVVLCRTASAGYSAIMGRDMTTSQDFATWTCGPLLRPRFLLLCLRVMRGDLLGRLAMGSTHLTIYMPEIESIKVPLPTVEEQDLIVRRVYSCLAPIDKAVTDLNRQIALLNERRQTLITATVTGEITVAGVAA